uniref:Uncharacterized protein n=1 Tax=Arundo donax TaxID=35708 RepID=A0A0A8ZAV8_ARUDO
MRPAAPPQSACEAPDKGLELDELKHGQQTETDDDRDPPTKTTTQIFSANHHRFQ